MSSTLLPQDEALLRAFLAKLETCAPYDALAKLRAEGYAIDTVAAARLLNDPQVALVQRGKLAAVAASIQDFALSELPSILKYQAFLAKGGDETLKVHPRDAASAARVLVDTIGRVLDAFRFMEAPVIAPRTINVGSINVLQEKGENDIVDGAFTVDDDTIRAAHFQAAEALFEEL